jgi:NAD(P)-dependent dehydrogenase (short-subunit alcohol dehydrogenase family)
MDTQYLRQLFGLEGQVIVITGGSGVLCGAMARSVARLGAQVVVMSRTLASLQTVVDDITAQGGAAVAVATDVTSKEQLAVAAEQVLSRFGRVDALINGAGGGHKLATTSPELSFFDLSDAAIRQVFELNFMGTLFPCQVFGRIMANQGTGNIINLASMSSIRSLTRVLAYSASKAAIKNYTEWLAVHMAQNYAPNIRVNAIAPGFFLTHLNRELLMNIETNVPTKRGQDILDHTPMGRYGVPDDLIGAIIWLLSPSSAFVTGTTVAVDGGFSAFSGV